MSLVLMELFRNPNDLSFWATQDNKTQKWAFFISRGPEQNGRILLNTEHAYSSFGEVTDAIEEILSVVIDYFGDESLPHLGLTTNHKKWIMSTLSMSEKHEAHTFRRKSEVKTNGQIHSD